MNHWQLRTIGIRGESAGSSKSSMFAMRDENGKTPIETAHPGGNLIHHVERSEKRS